jgi:hypothetical protein
LGCANGNDSLALTANKSQDFIHVASPQSNHLQLLIDRCVDDGFIPGGWVDANIDILWKEHLFLNALNRNDYNLLSV